MHIALIANGAFSSRLKEKMKAADLLFAVDGGLLHLDSLGLKPDLIIGDFDSAPEKIVKKYPAIEKKSLSKRQGQERFRACLGRGDGKGS
jgi:thiamine pyrophosphokinase